VPRAALRLLVFSAGVIPLFAQLQQKPSPLREPRDGRPDKPATERDALMQIKSRADFDLLQRTYYAGTRYAIPHIMFVVDRNAGGQVYFVNSQKFRFHKDFLYAAQLAPMGAKLDNELYFKQERRFMIGTIAWQASMPAWTWELWEGDLLPEAQVGEVSERLAAAFYEKLLYKPNSSRQEASAKALNLAHVTQAGLAGKQTYLALNTGKATGRVRFIKSEADLDTVEHYDIVVLDFLPLKLTPVRGIVVTMPSTPLSHINILAHGWGIPNVYIQDAAAVFTPLENQWIELTAGDRKYSWRSAKPAVKTETAAAPVAPAADTARQDILPLTDLTKTWSVAYGAKAANLGEVFNKLQGEVNIPEGFVIPFHYFERHMREHGFDKKLAQILAAKNFSEEKVVRKKLLAELRQKIEGAPLAADLQKQIQTRWKNELKSKPVFVRSSSNLEDLKNFSGAGLYFSAANQTNDRDIFTSVKKIWASLYNFEAFEARRHFGVDQAHIYMAVIVQTGIDMDLGGVLITRNPYLKTVNDAVLISTVCGHNSQIADNRGMPEQILVNYESNAVVVWTRSQQESALRFDKKGELKPTPVTCADTNGRILDDAKARSLAALALKIRTAFDEKAEQDIEWGVWKGQIYILQSRPYRD
jgi:rifampicin phosphotransferase